jgi:calcineurin-like phosphoesterase family protein
VGNCRLTLVNFSHENIIRYCKRPWKDADDMDYSLIANWNSVVAPEDMVYVVGDFTMKGYKQKEWFIRTLSALKGTKVLIYGNHDKLHPLEAVEVGFQSAHSSLWIDGIFLGHDPAWSTALPDGTNMMCGHVHDLFKLVENNSYRRVLNVGVDVWGYFPILFEDARAALLRGSSDDVKIDLADPNFDRHSNKKEGERG